MTKHIISDLYQMQSMPLNIKIRMTQRRIRDWVDYYGCDGVYVSFSGGKDSTVLLDIVRQIDPSILAVFVDTGLEYPEIREFVKTYANVQWIRPKKTFKQVIEDYGYPFFSKEISKRSRELSNAKKKGTMENCLAYKEFTGTRVGINDHVNSMYNKRRYNFLLNTPYQFSHRCCDVMKHQPFFKFEKETKRVGILATMASESVARMSAWLQTGCNAFDTTRPMSKPMSFWTEQDVLLYIKLYGKDMVQRRIESLENEYKCTLEQIIDVKTGKPKFVRENFTPICSVYGEIEEVEGRTNRIVELAKKAELDWLYNQDEPFLRTTGCDRTGCMFCGYGCHLEKPGEGRFLRMKGTHPKLYDYIMRSSDKGGLNYKEVIDWINENGGFHIEY